VGQAGQDDARPWAFAGDAEAGARLQKFHTDQRKAQIRRRADAQLAHLALQEALQAPAPDPKVIQARIKELSDLHTAQLQAHVDGQLLMKKVLTPDQQKKLEQLRAEHRGMGMGPGMGPGQGRGMGPMRQRRGPGAGPGPGGPSEDQDSGRPIGQ
jgi:Spy/CpxP family protein refolding chaperone